MNTRSILSIEQLNSIDEWNDDQLEQLYAAAVNNGQISSIINDLDIALFYKRLLKVYDFRNEDVETVEGMLV